MHISTSSRKTKDTYTIIIILATLLVLSGAGVTLYPSQAFADGEKDKPHDDKHKKPEDDKDKLLKAYIESVTAGIKEDHKPEPKKEDHKPESVTATTETATTESEKPKEEEKKKSEEPKK